MASKTRVPKAEITGIYGGLLKRMTRKMLGEVPEAAEVMWHHPAVLKDMMGFGRKAVLRRPRAAPRDGKHVTGKTLPAQVPLWVAHFVIRFVRGRFMSSSLGQLHLSVSE